MYFAHLSAQNIIASYHLLSSVVTRCSTLCVIAIHHFFKKKNPLFLTTKECALKISSSFCPQIRWTKTAGSVSDRFQDSSVFNETLHIAKILRTQGGRYYCKAENGLGSPAIKSIRVDVYCKCSISGLLRGGSASGFSMVLIINQKSGLKDWPSCFVFTVFGNRNYTMRLTITFFWFYNESPPQYTFFF